MKKWLWITCTVAIISISIASPSSSEESTVQLSGAKLIEGRTFLPLRSIFESLDATVQWDGTTKTVTAIEGDTTIELRLNSKTARINNKTIPLDVPVQLVNNITMVPVRFVGEGLQADVKWDSATQSATITTRDNKKIIVSVEDDQNKNVINNMNWPNIYEIEKGYIPGVKVPLGSPLSEVKQIYGKPNKVEQFIEGNYYRYKDLSFLFNESQTVETISVFDSRLDLDISDLTYFGMGDDVVETDEYIAKEYTVMGRTVTVYFDKKLNVIAFHLSEKVGE